MLGDSDFGRRRLKAGRTPRVPTNIPFANPYPWMSGIEARVKLALEQYHIPHSWRNFDGVSPYFTQLMGESGYQPEFTLRELNTVVMVQGAFWGALPQAVDNVSVATACFKQDGWNVVILWENDILNRGAWPLLLSNVPNILSVSGDERVNPYLTEQTKQALMKRKYRWRDSHPTITGGERDGKRSVHRTGWKPDSGRSRLGRIARGEDFRAR